MIQEALGRSGYFNGGSGVSGWGLCYVVTALEHGWTIAFKQQHHHQHHCSIFTYHHRPKRKSRLARVMPTQNGDWSKVVGIRH